MKAPIVRTIPSPSAIKVPWAVAGVIGLLIEFLAFTETRIPFIQQTTLEEFYEWFGRILLLILLISLGAMAYGLTDYIGALVRYVAGRWNDYPEWVAYGTELKALTDAFPALLERHSTDFGSSEHFELMPRFRMSRAEKQGGRLYVTLSPSNALAERLRLIDGDCLVLVDNDFPMVRGALFTVDQPEFFANTVVTEVSIRHTDGLLLSHLSAKAESMEAIESSITAFPVINRSTKGHRNG